MKHVKVFVYPQDEMHIPAPDKWGPYPVIAGRFPFVQKIEIDGIEHTNISSIQFSTGDNPNGWRPTVTVTFYMSTFEVVPVEEK